MTIQIKTFHVEGGGGVFENFKRVRVYRSLDSLAGTFDIEIAATGTKALPFRVGDECQILVDGAVQLTGYIEAASVSYSNDNHTVTFSGRDRTADVIDSNVGEWAVFSGGTLQDFTIDTLSKAGITDVSLTMESWLYDELAADPFSEGEGAAAGLGDTVFRYLEEYARKRQVLMTTDGYGNIKFVRTDDAKIKTLGIYNRLNNAGGANNVKEAYVRFDATQRFHFYRVSSGGNASYGDSDAGVDSVAPDAMAGTVTEVVDTAIRPSRVRHIQAESASNAEDCLNRAVWERNLSIGRYLSYEALLAGHSNSNGEAWELNGLYPIDDDFCNLQGSFLLSSIEWEYTLNGGATTRLIFVAPEAYSNISKRPPKTAKRGGRITNIP